MSTPLARVRCQNSNFPCTSSRCSLEVARFRIAHAHHDAAQCLLTSFRYWVSVCLHVSFSSIFHSWLSCYQSCQNWLCLHAQFIVSHPSSLPAMPFTLPRNLTKERCEHPRARRESKCQGSFLKWISLENPCGYQCLLYLHKNRFRCYRGHGPTRIIFLQEGSSVAR